jgi:hypothetical protein
MEGSTHTPPTTRFTIPQTPQILQIVDMFASTHRSIAKALANKTSTSEAYRVWTNGYLSKEVSDNIHHMKGGGLTVIIQLSRTSSEMYGTTGDAHLVGRDLPNSSNTTKTPSASKRSAESQEDLPPTKKSKEERLTIARTEKRAYESYNDYIKSIPIVLAVFQDHMDDTLRSLVTSSPAWREAESSNDLLRCWYLILKRTLFAIVDEVDFGMRLRTELITSQTYILPPQWRLHCTLQQVDQGT